MTSAYSSACVEFGGVQKSALETGTMRSVVCPDNDFDRLIGPNTVQGVMNNVTRPCESSEVLEPL